VHSVLHLMAGGVEMVLWRAFPARPDVQTPICLLRTTSRTHTGVHLPPGGA
jgi:hypothetical protein